jgi:hypothetical protein
MTTISKEEASKNLTIALKSLEQMYDVHVFNFKHNDHSEYQDLVDKVNDESKLIAVGYSLSDTSNSTIKVLRDKKYGAFIPKNFDGYSVNVQEW